MLIPHIQIVLKLLISMGCLKADNAAPDADLDNLT